MMALTLVNRRASTIACFTLRKSHLALKKSEVKRTFSLSRQIHKSAKNDPKKILFFGTDSFSLETLKVLHRNYLNPDSSVVSKLEVCCSEMKHLVQVVKSYSLESGLKIHNWPPDISSQDFDLGVVASFGYLIPTRLIETFPLGMLNVHASLLPRWRGASPIPHAILRGDEETGVTIMEIRPKHFDIGNMLAVQRLKIHPDETRSELEKRLSVLGADLMLDVIRDLDNCRLNSILQNEDNVTYAPKLTKKSFEVIWQHQTAQEVYNQWRALSDLGKLYSIWQDSGVMVHLGDIVPPDIVESFKIKEAGVEYFPGQTISIKRSKDRYICIKCSSGWISFRQFYYGPKKVMTPSDFYNGFMSKYKDRKQFFVSSEKCKSLRTKNSAVSS